MDHSEHLHPPLEDQLWSRRPSTTMGHLLSKIFDFVRDGRRLDSPFHFGLSSSVILMLAEYLVELEFSCPWEPWLRVCLPLSLALSVGFLVFITVYLSYGRPTTPVQHIACAVPPVIWVVLLLLDGDYLACAASAWEGRHLIPRPGPTNRGNRKTSLKAISQMLGYLLLFLASVLLFIWMFRSNNVPEIQRRRDRPEKRAQTPADDPQKIPLVIRLPDRQDVFRGIEPKVGHHDDTNLPNI